MRIVRALAVGVALFVVLGSGRAEASALTFTTSTTGPGSFSGNFTNGNDVAFLFFDLTEDAIFHASTTSGAAGGFDPLLTLLSVTGTNSLSWIADNDDSPLGGPDSLIVDPLTDLPGRLLHAGRYALALTQTFNYFDPLSGGFSFDDDAFYACAFVDPEQPCAGFAGVGGQAATSQFAASYDITPVSELAPVPEPATLTLFGSGLAALALRRKRRNS